MAVLRTCRRRGILVLAAWMVAALPAFAQRLEYEVKAAFMFNFIQFTEWPAGTFASGDEPFRVCLEGTDPFGAVLDSTMQGETLNGHRMTVERLRGDAPVDGCHVVFVPRSATARTPAIVRSAQRALLVGEDGGFLRQGGMIAFVVDAGRVRFDINTAAAGTRGIRFSSKLLRLARATLEDGTR